jgi:hypothetical protein
MVGGGLDRSGLLKWEDRPGKLLDEDNRVEVETLPPS